MSDYTQEHLSAWKNIIKSTDSKLVEAAGGMTDQAVAFIVKMVEEKYKCKSSGTAGIDFENRTLTIPVVSLRSFDHDVIFIHNLCNYLNLSNWTIEVKREA